MVSAYYDSQINADGGKVFSFLEYFSISVPWLFSAKTNELKDEKVSEQNTLNTVDVEEIEKNAMLNMLGARCVLHMIKLDLIDGDIRKAESYLQNQKGTFKENKSTEKIAKSLVEKYKDKEKKKPESKNRLFTVSYTHLTLPTIYSV